MCAPHRRRAAGYDGFTSGRLATHAVTGLVITPPPIRVPGDYSLRLGLPPLVQVPQEQVRRGPQGLFRGAPATHASSSVRWNRSQHPFVSGSQQRSVRIQLMPATVHNLLKLFASSAKASILARLAPASLGCWSPLLGRLGRRSTSPACRPGGTPPLFTPSVPKSTPYLQTPPPPKGHRRFAGDEAAGLQSEAD